MALGLLFYLSLIEDSDVAEYFKYIYVKYQQTMYNGAMSVLHNHHMAEDAVHEALFKLASSDKRIKDMMKHKYSEEEGPFLIQVCKQCAINMKNSAKEKHEETSDLETDMTEKYYNQPAFAVEEIFEEDTTDKDLVRELVLGMKYISDEDRNLIMMLFYRNLTFDRIAEETGWDRQTLYTKKSRAIKRLRKAVSEIRKKGLLNDD